jgi:hypothetical protein
MHIDLMIKLPLLRLYRMQIHSLAESLPLSPKRMMKHLSPGVYCLLSSIAQRALVNYLGLAAVPAVPSFLAAHASSTPTSVTMALLYNWS